MLNGMLDYLMVDYFNFRDLLLKGEKEAVRYWAIEDPGYLDSFMECLKEGDSRRKFPLYEALAEVTAAPVGGIWEEGHTVISIRPEAESDISKETEKALAFWEKLVDS